MKKLFTLLVALAASVEITFAEAVKIGDLYYELNTDTKKATVVGLSDGSQKVSVTDNSLLDWEKLPGDKVVSWECPADAAFLGLKGVAVYATDMYINILFEPNMEDIVDLSWVPFHVYIDADNSDVTGGYGDEFTDANTDILCESAIFSEGQPYNYNPAVFKWWGEVGGNGWEWTDPSVEHDGSDYWGAIIGEGQLPVGASEFVDGKFEIQLNRELLTTVHPMNNTEFGIGFDIDQKWSAVGILPCVNATDENPRGKAAKLKVKIDKDEYPEETINPNLVIPSFITYNDDNYTVTSIKSGALSHHLELTSIEIPTTLTSIGDRAFDGCSNITSVIWKAKNCNGYNFGSQVESFIFGDEVEIIPASICYKMDKLTSISISNSVTSIGNRAFQGCSGLTSVTIGNGIINIGDYAFYGCTGLISIGIPNAVTNIGNYAFYGCSSLTSVTIGNGILNIGDYAFYGCSGLTSIEIPNSVTSIGEGSFSNCSGLTFIEIPNNVTSIGNRAFQDCSSLNSIELSNSVTSIGDYAFSVCSGLTSVTIPNSVTSIGNYAFYGCSKLTTITIPAAVKQIGSYAFMNENRLQSITLGRGIETIGENAFASCPYIITIHANMELPPIIDTSVFANCGDLSAVDCYVQEGSLAFYRKTDVWKAFNLKIEEGPTPDALNCTIRYVDRDALLLDSEQVTLHLPEAPVIDGFTFLGWKSVDALIEETLTIQAVYEANEPTSAPAVYTNPANPAQKLIRNGNVYILTEGKTYTITGQEVR